MSFFCKISKFNSPINGELVLGRCFGGEWFLRIPEGEYYSGSYLEKMWKTILKKCRKNLNPENVLILGSGAGCAVNVTNNLWPKALMDALDYDPTMMEIGKRIYDFKNVKVNFIISEAADFIKKCKKNYDLIIIDLFYGNEPSPLLKDKDFISNIYRILKKPGTVLVNFNTNLSSQDKEIPKAWDNIFSELRQLSFHRGFLGYRDSNKILLAEKSDIPNDYYDIFQDNEWIESLKKKGFVVLGQTRSFIYILRLGPGLCIVNAMHTDSEPDPILIKNMGCRHGLIFWSQWEKKTASWPWMRSLIPIHQKGNGFSLVRRDYRKKWSQMVRRNLKKFKLFPIEIKLVSQESFIDGLKHSTLKPLLKACYSKMIKKMNKNSMEFFAARKNGEIIGGLAVVNYANISAHFVAYLTKEGRKFQAGIGLIDWWYKYALENNIKYLNFGHIRQAGEPRSLQGYSDFKRKFIDKEIRLSNGYWRFF